jgi:hypothetical protein
MQCDSNICIFLICESVFFNHRSVLQQKDIKILRENQRQNLKIARLVELTNLLLVENWGAGGKVTRDVKSTQKF